MRKMLFKAKAEEPEDGGLVAVTIMRKNGDVLQRRRIFGKDRLEAFLLVVGEYVVSRGISDNTEDFWIKPQANLNRPIVVWKEVAPPNETKG